MLELDLVQQLQLLTSQLLLNHLLLISILKNVYKSLLLKWYNQTYLLKKRLQNDSLKVLVFSLMTV